MPLISILHASFIKLSRLVKLSFSRYGKATEATNEEMAAVARHLRLTRDELIKFMQSRQLDLFEDL